MVARALLVRVVIDVRISAIASTNLTPCGIGAIDTSHLRSGAVF